MEQCKAEKRLDMVDDCRSPLGLNLGAAEEKLTNSSEKMLP